MTEMVAIPWWLFALFCIAMAVALVDRVFAPGVRWFFRRRINKAIGEINTRLDLQIKPFKLTRRQSLVDQLMYDEQVLEAVQKEADLTNTPREVVMARAQRYAREIVPNFNVLTYFGLGTRLAKWLSQLIYRVRLGYADQAALESVKPQDSVVFVMNHRSNMDYVFVTFMVSSRATLSYAVGEWARVWLLQSFIRAMGAYFIRRDSGDELYRKVLSRYVRLATRQGVTQAVFPEGGLTRDGSLRDPRLGLLSYMVSDFDTEHDPDILFIPVGLNYDRVIEDRILTGKIEKETTGRNFRVTSGSLFKVFWQLIVLRLKGKLYRAGYAVASFGRPLSLKTYVKEMGIDFRTMQKTDRFEAVEALGEKLIGEIGRMVPALPVPMVAKILLEADGTPLSELAIKSRLFELAEKLEAKGLYLHVPRHDRDYAVSTGLRMLTLRHLAQETEDGLIIANPKETILLRYYANSIKHLFYD